MAKSYLQNGHFFLPSFSAFVYPFLDGAPLRCEGFLRRHNECMLLLRRKHRSYICSAVKGDCTEFMKGKNMKILLHWRKNWISLPGRKYIQTMMNCRTVEDMNWMNSWFSETGDMLIMKVMILNPVQNRNTILSWLQAPAVIRLPVRSVLCGISTL